ncbi:MAG TPA: hypothetical protein VFM51_08135 [Solirubrobacterales bacterium]|nr:hypothetical protein [Solirubrobacterales bacterium]
MIPAAHVAHYAIWILYAIPVLIVSAAIVRSMLLQKREGPDDRED